MENETEGCSSSFVQVKVTCNCKKKAKLCASEVTMDVYPWCKPLSY